MKKERGITLIALIITIIILVILAAVSINAVYNSKIIDYAVNGTSNYIAGAKKEEEMLSSIEEQIKNAQIMTDSSYDIHVAFISSTGTLRFASTKEGLGEYNISNGDQYYGNIKGKVYKQVNAETKTADTPWTGVKDNITNVEFVYNENVNKIKPVNTACWFYGLTNLTNIDVGNMDTSECTAMNATFRYCESLKRIGNIENLDTSKSKTIRYMFYNCLNLGADLTNDTNYALNLSNWNTSNVEDMQYMFCNCYSLKNIDISGFNTANVENMDHMFYFDELNGARSTLESINFGDNFKTNKVTTIAAMFNGCTAIASLDISGWDTQNVTNMGSVFNTCRSLQSLDISGWNTQNVTNMSFMFGACRNLENLTLGNNFKTDNVTTMADMFAYCDKLQSLNISEWNVEKVETMYEMFRGCLTLASLDISGWNTKNVKDMYYMFGGCTNLATLTLGNNFKTDNVTTMRGMFVNDSKLGSLDVSGWNVEKVNNFRGMFFGCIALTVDCSGWSGKILQNTDHGSFNWKDLNGELLPGVTPPTWPD